MYTQILAISSILIGIFILIQYFKQNQLPQPFPSKPQFHMGCYIHGNSQLNKFQELSQFLTSIDQKLQQNHHQPITTSIIANIKTNTNEAAKSVGMQFQKYLNKFYNIKSKGIYEQNYHTSLNLAQQQYKTCKQTILQNHNKQKCIQAEYNFNQSLGKFHDLTGELADKIAAKQEQQRKISSLILNSNFTNQEQYERTIDQKIKELNGQLELANLRKIQFTSKQQPLREVIAVNKSKIETDTKLLNECIDNMKIIHYCNELNEELKAIKFVYTKEDLELKIQRKKMIILAHQTAIKNAQRLGNTTLAAHTKVNLVRNEQQLQLLEARISDFKTYEQSYCQICTDEKVQQLRQTLTQMTHFLSQAQEQLSQLITLEDQQTTNINNLKQQIDQLNDELEFHTTNSICLTPQCQQQRSNNIKDMNRILNERKNAVLDHKLEFEEHRLKHQESIKEMNLWFENANQAIDCLNKRYYYEKMRENQPQSSQEEQDKIQVMKSRLVEKLNVMSY